MDFIKKFGLRVVAGSGVIQALSWIFGIFNEVYQWIEQNRLLVLLLIVVYGVLYYISYDAAEAVEKSRYASKLKGASIRKTITKKAKAPLTKNAKRAKGVKK